MAEFDSFPDAEAVAGHALREADLGAGVYSSIPKTPTYPLIAVRRLVPAAPAEEHHLDTANLQVDVYGNSKSEAHDIARDARIILLELAGQTAQDPVPAFISAVETVLGLFWNPDPDTDRDRYTFGVLMFSHSAPAGS